MPIFPDNKKCKRPLGNLPIEGRGKKQGSGRQGWDKAEASRIEPKSPNVGQKHGARSGQNKTVL